MELFPLQIKARSNFLQYNTYGLLKIKRVELAWCSGKRNGLPRDGPGFNSRLERCIYQASRPLQGAVNGGAVSK